MSTYVELTNTELKVINAVKNGKMIEIKSHQQSKSPVTNGGMSGVVDVISEMKSDLSKLVYIDNTNNVIYYDMRVPNIGKDKILTICKNELKTKLNRKEELLIDYFEIKKESESEKRILVTALPLLRVKSFVESAKMLKARKNEIRVAYEGIFNYMDKAKVFTDKESVVAIEVKEDSIRSWLFEGGEYVNLRSNRIRTDEYSEVLDLVSDDISKLIQFQSTRRRSYLITKVYLFGDNINIQKVIEDLNTEFKKIGIEKLPLIGDLVLPNDFEYLDNIYSMGIILGDM
jgi:hypothetical protein